jgi:hypothetical protein
MGLSKKGQGLSLNVIIIAALALIVLVILVAIFTGRLGIFDSALGEEGDSELIKMRISYSQCAPSSSDEATFKREYSTAESLDDKDQATQNYRTVIDRCAVYNEKVDCTADSCRWR